MQIIAKQEYTDKYVSLYEGQIRNINDSLANSLIEKGIVAEHDEDSGGIPSGGWIRVSVLDPPDFVFNSGPDTLMRFEDYLTSSSSSAVYLGWKVPKWFNPELGTSIVALYTYLRSAQNESIFLGEYEIGEIGTDFVMWMQNVTRSKMDNAGGIGPFVLMKGSDLQPAGGNSYSNLADIIDTDEWVIIIQTTIEGEYPVRSIKLNYGDSISFKILDTNNQG